MAAWSMLRAVTAAVVGRFRRNETGASIVEYALLLSLIAVVAILALYFLGGTVANSLSSSGNSLVPNP